MNHEEQRCHACNLGNLIPFFVNYNVPADVGNLPRTPLEAKTSACGDIQLVACDVCGLVENRKYDASLIGFEPGYGVSLHHTPTFQEYIRGVCDRLIAEYDLRGKKLLEIGCGSAEFLRMICCKGGNHGVGIDPTLGKLAHESCGTGSIQLIPDYYSDRYQDLIGDFVCCLSVFEDIPRPVDFLKSLRKSIGNRNVPLYFEVFNGYRAISDREVWSVHYEQCNYFSLSSLQNMFLLADFEITKSGTCYQGDQYIYVEAVPVGTTENVSFELPHNFDDDVNQFTNAFSHRLDWWDRKLEEYRAEGKRVYCWGSGGKGVSFLSSVPNADVIEHVIDINPDRQNQYMPTTCQAIVGPDILGREQPDVVVVTNVLYQHEIRETLAANNIECELVIA